MMLVAGCRSFQTARSSWRTAPVYQAVVVVVSLSASQSQHHKLLGESA